MYYRNNIGCMGLLITLFVIAVLGSILFSPITWVIVIAIGGYAYISRKLREREYSQNEQGYYRQEDTDYGTRGYDTPYTRGESIPEVTPFTEDEFDTTAMDVDVEVEIE